MMSPTPLGGAPGGDWVRLHEKGSKEHESRPITISIATSPTCSTSRSEMACSNGSKKTP
jgi:hypothetical protein